MPLFLSRRIYQMELMLRRELFAFYQNKIASDFDLDVESINDYKLELSPLIYASLLNKRVTPKPRAVLESHEFSVPEKYQKDWGQLKKLIKEGGDIKKYQSKDIDDWRKVDYLLFSCNITHIHFTSKNGKGTNRELVFGIVTNDEFYALYVGDHNDLYKPELFYEIAESNWPGRLFQSGQGKASRDNYTKRLANDPSHHHNLIKPIGTLQGHQHTTLVGIENDNLKNISLKSLIAYNNEVDYLNDLEEKLCRKFGYDIPLKLEVDLMRKRYKIRIQRPFMLPMEKPFTEAISCSRLASESGI